jgi:hypothetical protein
LAGPPQHTQMATGSSMAMSMWAPAGGPAGGGGTDRRSRAYCARVPPPHCPPRVCHHRRGPSENYACSATLNLNARCASTGSVGIKTYTILMILLPCQIFFFFEETTKVHGFSIFVPLGAERRCAIQPSKTRVTEKFPIERRDWSSKRKNLAV